MDIFLHGASPLPLSLILLPFGFLPIVLLIKNISRMCQPGKECAVMTIFLLFWFKGLLLSSF